jgi:hypothetical protein
METIDVHQFIEYLQQHDLVIAPAALVRVDKRSMQLDALAKPALTYREISECGLWGDITQKRAYQLAKLHGRDAEIIKPGEHDNSPEKILTAAVKRIAILRQIPDVTELIHHIEHENQNRT